MPHNISLIKKILSNAVQEVSNNTKTFSIEADVVKVSFSKEHLWLTVFDGTQTIKVYVENKFKYIFKKCSGTHIKKGIKIFFTGDLVAKDIDNYYIRLSFIERKYEKADYKKNIDEIKTKLSEIDLKIVNRKTINDIDLKRLKIAMLSPIDSEAIYDFKASIKNKLKYGEDDHYYPDIKSFEFKYDRKSFTNGFNVSQLNLAIDTKFDCIVIARGGGTFQQLNLINNYLLAETIAKSPIPIYLAVGHARDLHALDHIVSECFFTPSSCAHYFLEKFKSDSYSRYKKSKEKEKTKYYKERATENKPKKSSLTPFLVFGVIAYVLYRMYHN